MVPKVPKHTLEEFIDEKMSMSHIYQPAMLKVLLENGGEASVEEIAKSFLLHDISQVEYYSMRTNNMLGKVLRDHGIVRPDSLIHSIGSRGRSSPPRRNRTTRSRWPLIGRKAPVSQL